MVYMWPQVERECDRAEGHAQAIGGRGGRWRRPGNAGASISGKPKGKRGRWAGRGIFVGGWDEWILGRGELQDERLTFGLWPMEVAWVGLPGAAATPDPGPEIGWEVVL